MNEETQKIVEEIQANVAKAVTPGITEEVMKAMEAKLVDRKGVMGDQNADAELREQKETAAKMFQSLEAKELRVLRTKAMDTATSTAGAELVPTAVSSEALHIAQNVGLVRKYGNRWEMGGSKVDVPTAGSLTAYRVAEGVKVNSSKPTTGAVSLASKTVGVIVPVSRKLLRNSSPALVTLINKLAFEAIAMLEDKWAILGLDTGEGVFQHASVNGVTLGSGKTTYGSATPEDLLDVMDMVDDNISEDKLRWVLSRSVLNGFRKQRGIIGSDKQGFLFEGFGGSLPATMWDSPYSLHTMMPKRTESAGSQAGKKFMALVNFDNIILGDDEAYTYEMSEQATITDTNGSTLINLFEQNMVGIKVTGEIDIQIANPASTAAWLKTAAS